MLDASGTVGADLDGVGSAGEEGFSLTVMELSKVFGDESGVIEATGANVLADGGKGNDNGGVGEIW